MRRVAHTNEKGTSAKKRRRRKEELGQKKGSKKDEKTRGRAGVFGAAQREKEKEHADDEVGS